jgi:hypothetical protein
MIATVTPHTFSIRVLREKVHELGKYETTLVHQPFLSYGRKGKSMAETGNEIEIEKLFYIA